METSSTSSSRPVRLAVMLLLALALLARVAAVFVIGDREIPHEFGILVPNLLEGRGYSYYSVDQNDNVVAEYLANPKASLPSAYMPPAFPFFMAGVARLAGGVDAAVLAAELIQSVFSTLTCWLIYLTIRRAMGTPTALIALAISAVYPMLIYSSSQISAVTLYVLLSQLVLYLLFRLYETKNRKTQQMLSLAAGLVMGLLILARAETLLLAILAGLWLAVVYLRRNLLVALIYAAAVVLALTPWCVRNVAVFGEITPLTISGGYNLWQGQNENATGTLGDYVVPPVEPSAEMQARIKAIKPDARYELAVDDLFKDEAIRSMKAAPLRVVTMALKKFELYWFGIYFGFEMDYPGVHSPVILLPWYVLLPFFACGLIRSFREWRRFMLLYLLLAASTGVAMGFFVLPRYPIFVLPTVIIFAAYGFAGSPLFIRVINRLKTLPVRHKYRA